MSGILADCAIAGVYCQSNMILQYSPDGNASSYRRKTRIYIYREYSSQNKYTVN